MILSSMRSRSSIDIASVMSIDIVPVIVFVIATAIATVNAIIVVIAIAIAIVFEMCPYLKSQ